MASRCGPSQLTTPQSGAAPVVDLDAMIGGRCATSPFGEVTSSGGMGNNFNCVFACRSADYSTERVPEITAFGGTRAYSVNAAHLRCRSASTGGTSNSAFDVADNHAFEIGFGDEHSFECLHPYSATWGRLSISVLDTLHSSQGCAACTPRPLGNAGKPWGSRIARQRR